MNNLYINTAKNRHHLSGTSKKGIGNDVAENLLVTRAVRFAGSKGSQRKEASGGVALALRAASQGRAMMPTDLREWVWNVFAHGGDFQPGEPYWTITGLQEIPAHLSTVLESPQYAPYVLQAAEAEKRLNNEAEALHAQLYGKDYYPESMRHQLLARYHQIEANRRIRGLCPLSRRYE